MSTEPKGRPTPKRSEKVRQRVPVKAPQTRKEAYALARAQAKDRRSDLRRGIAAGDPAALPARDRGPARALTRDLVDAGPSASPLVYGGLFLILLASFFIRGRNGAVIVNAVYLVFFVAVIAYLALRVRRVVALVRERLPEEPTRGLGGYAFQRCVQPRVLRMPKPRVKRGQPV